MRYIFAVLFLIMLLIVPWLMYHPEYSEPLFSMIGSAENDLASVIISHNPKTIDGIKADYKSVANANGPAANRKVEILLVPGHEPDFGGAEYADIKERDMTVELAQELQNLLDQNDRYEVFVTRDNKSWSPTFADYFKNYWKDISSWINGHKDEVAHLSNLGEFHPLAPTVLHNSVPLDVAMRLYGVSKWANENDVDIVIHIHFNDNPGHSKRSPGKYSGFAIYVPQGQYFNSSTTQSIAAAIFNRLHKYNAVSNLPIESAGIIQDQDLIAVGAYNSVDAASMLIEYGYIYEPQFNDPKLKNVAIKDLAFQTYLGLQDFFDVHNSTNIAGNFDTLVMPYSWKSPVVDRKTADSKDIFSLQTALVYDGEYPPKDQTLNECPRSGSLGSCTKTAISGFQKKNNIIGEEGTVGPKTMQLRNNLYGNRAI